MAKYPYIVNKNGVWYPAGAEVPEDSKALKNNTDDEKTEEKEVQYTKTDINRMPVAELREMAMRTGVEGADTWSGAELKEYLITIFGL